MSETNRKLNIWRIKNRFVRAAVAWVMVPITLIILAFLSISLSAIYAARGVAKGQTEIWSGLPIKRAIEALTARKP